MRSSILFILIGLYLFSCTSKIEDSKLIEIHSNSPIISFEKVDSIKIEYLGNPVVQDIHPGSKNVIFFESEGFSKEIFVAKFDGKITNSFSKSGDKPDSYGILLSSIRFLDENSFLVYGSNGFLTYDLDGKMLARQKLMEFKMPDRPFFGMGHGMEKLGDRYLFVNQEFPPNRDYSDRSFLKHMYLLKWLYPQTGEVTPFIQFPESSIFRNGKFFFRNAWDVVFDLGDGLIYVVFGLEPVIYVFENKPPYTLASDIPIKFNEFRNFKGEDSFTDEIRSFTDRFKSAFIENIKKIDNYFIVAYFPGYDNLDMEESKTNKSPAEWAIFREKIKKKYPYRIAIVDSLGNVINDFVPEGLEPKSMLIRNGELWMMEKPDEELERDYFRLFRVGLKIED